MQLNNFLAKRQTYSVTFGILTIAATVKCGKYVINFFGRYSNTFIYKIDKGFLFRIANTYFTLLFMRKLAAVFHQVNKSRSKQILVPFDSDILIILYFLVKRERHCKSAVDIHNLPTCI